MEDKISIIIHPTDRELLYDYEPGMRRLSIDVAKKILEWVSPFKVSSIEGIKSEATGERLNGELIMCSLLTEQMVSMNPRKVLTILVKAAKFAKEKGAKLVGLVGYTAMMGAKGVKLYNKINVPLTTGTHLTFATVPETILKAISLLGYPPKKLKVLIFGANPLVHIVLEKLGNSLGQFYLYHSLRDRVIKIYNYLPSGLKKKVKIISRNPRYFLKDMDIVINATSRLPAGFEEKKIKKRSDCF